MDRSRLSNFHVVSDARGIVTAVLDLPGRAYNVFTAQVLAELQAIVDSVEQDRSVRLLVFRSGKESGFLAGADLREISEIEDTQRAQQFVSLGQEVFNRLESLTIPTVAAIHGPCLGGGMEFAFACRFRVARDNASTRLGLPECKMGLLSAWGGTQRLPKLVGYRSSFANAADWSDRLGTSGIGNGPCRRCLDSGSLEHRVGSVCCRSPGGCATLATAVDAVDKGDDQTEPGDLICLRRARRRLAFAVGMRPPLPAILSAVEEGQAGGRQAGLAYEQKAFSDLLFSDFCRRRLARFLRRSGSRTKQPWVEDITIGAALRQTAKLFGDREALVFPQAEVRMTWREFDRAVDRAARGLLAIGLKYGDRFGIWSTNWPQWVILQFATASGLA